MNNKFVKLELPNPRNEKADKEIGLMAGDFN